MKRNVSLSVCAHAHARHLLSWKRQSRVYKAWNLSVCLSHLNSELLTHKSERRSCLRKRAREKLLQEHRDLQDFIYKTATEIYELVETSGLSDISCPSKSGHGLQQT